jgi:hypothetical protein
MINVPSNKSEKKLKRRRLIPTGAIWSVHTRTSGLGGMRHCDRGMSLIGVMESVTRYLAYSTFSISLNSLSPVRNFIPSLREHE